jgi:fibronectin type 3 domain-containing protein
MKKFIIIISAMILVIAGCIGPEEVIAPNHFDRSPIPYGLSGVRDTTTAGKAYVNLNWRVDETTNVRYFEVYRRRNRENSFQRVAIPATQNYTDSTIAYRDTLLYFVRTIANDLFISGHSDTIRIQTNQ